MPSPDAHVSKLIRPFEWVRQSDKPTSPLEVVNHPIGERSVSVEIVIDQQGLARRASIMIARNPRAPKMIVNYKIQEDGDAYRLSERHHLLEIQKASGGSRLVEIRRELFSQDGSIQKTDIDNQAHQFPLYTMLPRVGEASLSPDRVDELVDLARNLEDERGDVFVDNLPDNQTQITFYRTDQEALAEYVIVIDQNRHVTEIRKIFMSATPDDGDFERVYAAETSRTKYAYSGNIPISSVVSRPNGSEITTILRKNVPFSLVTSVATFNGIGPEQITDTQAELLCSSTIQPSETPVAEGIVFVSEQSTKKNGTVTKRRTFKIGPDTYAIVELKVIGEQGEQIQSARIDLI